MTYTLEIQESKTLEETRQHMHDRLDRIVPPAEIDLKAELAFRINQLKRERNAVILGHNYMEPALYHSVPDYVGDSLDLSRISAETDADVIVFCGVRFMAETAKILNPDKMVLIPSLDAGCSLAASITADDVRDLKKRYPGVPVVTYVNTYADVKAESDYCCTSSNAAAVIRHLEKQGHDKVIFLPDEYLARNTARETGMPIVVPSKPGAAKPGDPDNLERAMIGWHGLCEVHEKFTADDIINVRKQFPDVVVLAHPECSPEVIELCDFSGSTKAMIDYVRKTEAPRYLLLTECSMGDNIIAETPQKEMLRLCSVRCPHMNQITLEDTLESLEKLQYEIHLDPEIIARAKPPIDRMLEIG